MIFAAKINAEPGWKVVLSKNDGSTSIIELKEWGIIYEGRSMRLVPLDSITGNNIMMRDNYVMLLDPNEKYDIKAIRESVRRAFILMRESRA